MPKTKKEEIVEEVIENEEENYAEKVADLTIEIDSLKDKIENLESENKNYKTKYEDEHKANIRLMNRINDREEKIELEEKKVQKQYAKLSDIYNFKNGHIELK